MRNRRCRLNPWDIPGVTYEQGRRKLMGSSEEAAVKQDYAPPYLAFLHSRQRQNCPTESDCYIGLNSYQAPSTGSGVSIYVFSDKVDPTNVDFYGDRVSVPNIPSIPLDDDSPCSSWYGNHYAALAAGQIHGVAKSARIISVARSQGCLRPLATRSVLTGLQWILDDVRSGLRGGPSVVLIDLVVEVSTVDSATVQVIEDLVTAITAANATVVSLAGARGDDACNFSPARMPGVLTVGALNVMRIASTQDLPRVVLPWKHSNFGKCVDLWAPGTFIESASSGRDDTLVMSGTMQATSIVAGVVATFLSVHRDASPV